MVSMDVVSPETYNDGEWHHIVAVQDNSINGGRLYVDGIEVGVVQMVWSI